MRLILSMLKAVSRCLWQLTDVGGCCPIRNTVEQTDQTSIIANCLLVPNNIFVRTVAFISRLFFVLLGADEVIGHYGDGFCDDLARYAPQRHSEHLFSRIWHIRHI